MTVQKFQLFFGYFWIYIGWVNIL